MIKLTLDTNVIIKALKPHEIGHGFATRLIGLHQQGKIVLQVVAASASEYGRSMFGSDRGLQTELDKLGLQNVHILPIPLILNVSLLGYSYLVGDETIDRLKKIWAVLFPSAPFGHKEFCAFHGRPLIGDNRINRLWRNHMCDALTVLEYVRDTELHAKADDITILVSADSDDIVKKAHKLVAVGAKHIINLDAKGIQKIEEFVYGGFS